MVFENGELVVRPRGMKNYLWCNKNRKIPFMESTVIQSQAPDAKPELKPGLEGFF